MSLQDEYVGNFGWGFYVPSERERKELRSRQIKIFGSNLNIWKDKQDLQRYTINTSRNNKPNKK